MPSTLTGVISGERVILTRLVKLLLHEPSREMDGSVAVSDQLVISRCVADPDFPFLISFPRTGSHWLRMIMELYFERPLLLRVFYFKEKTNYLALHTHDMELEVRRNNVIYLYRDPVPTIYSQMVYEQEVLTDQGRMIHWASLYGRHLKKWLLDETACEKKTVVSYERMLKDLPGEFKKITAHFGQSLDLAKLQEVSERASKQDVMTKTLHDQKVMSRDPSYEQKRVDFSTHFSGLIESEIFDQTPGLRGYFSGGSPA
jgi:hypothetical protein